MKYMYYGTIYNNLEEVEEAILEEIGDKGNNIDVKSTGAYESEWDEVEELLEENE